MAPADKRALIAVDLGAESCRVSLLRWVDDKPYVQLVHRFANGPILGADSSLRWPLHAIVAGAEDGLSRCADLAPEGVRSVAVDGWAVDYVRLNADGDPLAAPFCYRDERTVIAEQKLHEKISPERLQEITGLQLQRINTLYQMVADRLGSFPCGKTWINLPEYVMHRWGAPAVAEYTNATHTELVDQRQRTWSSEILAAAEIDAMTMPALTPAGTLLGKLKGPCAKLPAFESTELIAPACHDTASAIAGIALDGDDWGYISSGTWSLVGTVLGVPCQSDEVQSDGFTNLGGVAGSVLFHASMSGMWLLKQCMDGWAAAGTVWDISELVAKAEAVPAPSALIEVDDEELLLVGDMPGRINAQLLQRGFATVSGDAKDAPAMASLIFHSLAERYRVAFEDIERHTGKRIRRIVIVGGGSRNEYLRRLTADRTGREVLCGSAESSTLGNFAVQLAALESAGNVDSFGPAVKIWAALLAEHDSII